MATDPLESTRFLAESIPQLVWTAAADGDCDYFNRRWTDYTGLSQEELRGWGWERVVHPDQREAVRRRVRAWIASGEAYEHELLLRRADGTYRWHLSRAVPQKTASGEIAKWLGTCTDIDDHRRAEQTLRFLTEVTSTLVSSTPDYESTVQAAARACVPVIADGCVIDVIESEGELRRVAGVDARPDKAEVMARLLALPPPPPSAPVYEVLKLERATLSVVEEDHFAKAARDQVHEAILRAIDARSLIVAPLRARGRPTGIIWLYTAAGRPPYTEGDLRLVEDLARRLALVLDNARLYRDARDAVRLRDDFLSIASHELKTPLTPLKLQLGRLRRRADMAKDVLDKLVVAERQVDRLTRLVDQLLDVTRIAAGRLALEREEVDLVALVRAAIDDVATELRRSGSPLVVQAPNAVIGRWDKTRVEQVVHNLLTNAIKYGESKPIDVVVEDLGARVRLQVVDHGIGIGARDQARIFGRFERAVSTRHFGGFGLGLWIVRQVVEASGGSIHVTSAEGAGSSFVVELPK